MQFISIDMCQTVLKGLSATEAHSPTSIMRITSHHSSCFLIERPAGLHSVDHLLRAEKFVAGPLGAMLQASRPLEHDKRLVLVALVKSRLTGTPKLDCTN